MAGIELRDLSIRLGGRRIIDGLNLEVEEGEFLVLLGPSGCGKSTLLHGIAGLVDVDSGRVRIGGQDVTEAEPAERGIGMVFQSYALYPTMSVERNLSFGLRVAGTPAGEVDRRVQEVARLLQLDALLKRKPSQLSGGQRQRVAIGRALVRDAAVYLLDEPLSNLDAQLRAELRRELKLLHRRLGATFVYVTHDQVEALTLASRIVVMQGGRVQQVGTPAEVYERPANRFVAGFLGAPGMNFVDGRLRAEGGSVRFVGGPFDLPLNGLPLSSAARDGLPVVLGVRPEHLRLHLEPTLGAAGSEAVGAQVQLVEPMGNQQVVWLHAQGNPLAVLLHEGVSVQAEQAAGVSVTRGRVSVFCAESGVRL